MCLCNFSEKHSDFMVLSHSCMIQIFLLHMIFLKFFNGSCISSSAETSNSCENLFIECTCQLKFASLYQFRGNYRIAITLDKSKILITLNKATVSRLHRIAHILSSKISHLYHAFNLSSNDFTHNNMFMHVGLSLLQEISYLLPLELEIL